MSDRSRGEQKRAEVGVGGVCAEGSFAEACSDKARPLIRRPIMGAEQSKSRTKQVLCNQRRAAERDEPAGG